MLTDRRMDRQTDRQTDRPSNSRVGYTQPAQKSNKCLILLTNHVIHRRIQLFEKGGPKGKGEALAEGRRPEGGMVRKGGPLSEHARKIKNEMSLNALWLI